ncbi:hypothetical protein [Allocoleopsis sp.]|uniref:hypothetical protein n=1 Tax=Allocoleopsis sp. TaxID=3088169 RepID=UPI002FD50DFF
MVLVRLETSDGRFVANVEVLPFLSAPDVVLWGERHFKLHQENPATYRECFVAVSLTTGEKALELSR